MWYLLNAKEDNSLCIVHEKNLLKAGSIIQLKEVVKFFYNGKEYTGPVLFKSMDHDEVDIQLKKLSQQFRKRANKPAESTSQQTNSTKRRVTPTQFYGSNATAPKQNKNDTAKMSEEEKKRQRIKELNLKEAKKKRDAALLSEIGVQNYMERDSDYEPDSADEKSSGNEYFEPPGCQSKERRQLVKGLKEVSHSPPSPSNREAILAQIESLKKTLSTEHDSEKSGSIKNVGKGKKKDDNEKGEKDENEKGEKDENEKGEKDDNEKGEKDENENYQNKSDTMDNDSDIFDGCGNSSSFKDDKAEEKLTEEDYNIDDFSTDGLDEQLYGQGEDTRLLTKNIYCKKTVLTSALASSLNVNSLVRKLLTGVFVPSKLRDCTVSGQSWRAGGSEMAALRKFPLHPVAIQAIIDFSNAVARKKKWQTKKPSKLKPVIARRLIEIKKAVREGKM